MTRSLMTAIDRYNLYVASRDMTFDVLNATATNSTSITATTSNSILNISATATGSNSSQDLTNTVHKGLLLYITVGSLTVNTATLAVNVNGKDPFTGSYMQVGRVSLDGIAANGTFVAQFYPGLSGNQQASTVVPPTYQVQASLTITTTASMSGTLTYKIGGAQIL